MTSSWLATASALSWPWPPPGGFRKAVILLAPAALNGLDLPSFASDALVAPPPEARARKWFLQRCEGDIGPYARVSAPRALRFLNAGLPHASPSIPMLCLSGTFDHSVFHKAGQDEDVATALGADFAVIEGGSHCFMLDGQWRKSAAAILGWLPRAGVAPVHNSPRSRAML